MKTMCPPGYHHNGIVAIHLRAHCFQTDLHVYYTRYAVRFEHSVITYITLLASLVEHSLVHWYQQQFHIVYHV